MSCLASLDATEAAAVVAPIVTVLLAIWGELRRWRRDFATEARVGRGWFASIAKAVGAAPPTFPAPPPPRSPDDMETSMRRFPRVLPVLFALVLSLPLAACVSTDRGVTFEPAAATSEVLAVKDYATTETGTLRREIEAAEARVRADMEAADARVRADLEGQVNTSNAAWTKAVAEGKSFGEAAAAAAAAVAGQARADAERAATLATEAGSRSSDALKRADAAGESRRKDLEDVLRKAQEGKVGWLELVSAVLGTGTVGGYAWNRYRNATRAAALAGGAAAASKPATS